MSDLTVLILIDIQQGLDQHAYFGGNRNNPEFETTITQLLNRFREKKLPIIHIAHDSIMPDSPLKRDLPGGQFKPEAQPIDGEPVIYKSVNSAFIGTDLLLRLMRLNAKSLVMAGLTTDHCVSTSVRMASNLNFDVTLIADGCAAFDKTMPNGKLIDSQTVHEVNLACLHGEFAQVVSLKELVF